jgi:hypothetical protein
MRSYEKRPIRKLNASGAHPNKTKDSRFDFVALFSNTQECSLHS